MSDSGRFTIGLVEDMQTNWVIATKMLQLMGCDVIHYENGALALQGLPQVEENVSMVLMDIMMPVMDGEACTRRLLDQGFSKPIVAYTASASPEDVTRYLDIGFADVLPKPVTLLELEVCLHNWVSPNIHVVKSRR